MLQEALRRSVTFSSILDIAIGYRNRPTVRDF